MTEKKKEKKNDRKVLGTDVSGYLVPFLSSRSLWASASVILMSCLMGKKSPSQLLLQSNP